MTSEVKIVIKADNSTALKRRSGHGLNYAFVHDLFLNRLKKTTNG